MDFFKDNKVSIYSKTDIAKKTHNKSIKTCILKFCPKFKLSLSIVRGQGGRDLGRGQRKKTHEF